MGMTARRFLGYLDTNVVAALAQGEAAAVQFMESTRRNGTDLCVSATVVDEIAAAPLAIRRRLVAAATKHCRGFSVDSAGVVVNEEILRAVDGGPTLGRQMFPIHRLGSAVTKSVLDQRGVTRPKKAELVSMNEGARSLEMCATFHEFFHKHRAYIARKVRARLDWEVQSAIDGRHPKARLDVGDKYGAGFLVGMLLANAYRVAKREGKPEGVITDIPIMVEVAHADEFFTRDEGLLACAALLGEVLPGVLRVTRVPS